jgi:hypothetical protein
MLAEAVEASVVPVRAVLVTEVIDPVVGVTVTVIAVPIGMPLAARVTVTGFEIDEGRVISADPVGFAGAATPATEVICRVGLPGTKTLPGEPTV